MIDDQDSASRCMFLLVPAHLVDQDNGHKTVVVVVVMWFRRSGYIFIF